MFIRTTTFDEVKHNCYLVSAGEFFCPAIPSRAVANVLFFLVRVSTVKTLLGKIDTSLTMPKITKWKPQP